MKLIVIVAVFVMFVVAVGGCGQTKKDDEEAQARESEEPTEAEGAGMTAVEETGGEAEAEEATSEEEGAEAEAEETTVSAEETEVELEEISVTEADDGEEIELALGQVIVVTLAADQTTEYRWDVAPFVEPVVKRVGKREYTPSEPEGTGGKLTLRFEAVSTGRAPLQMFYRRPGERTPQPKKKFAVTLVVR